MKKDYWYYLALAIVAILFVTLFSTTTSPLYGLRDELDSYVYQTIGKYWVQGYLPYVDLWDQKGPIIYMINAIGYWMTGTKTGVYLIQLVFMTMTSFFMYKVYRMVLKPSYSLLGVCFSLFCLYNLYAEGNHVEEYLLPFLVIALYLQYIWICQYSVNKKSTHNPWYAALYGFILAFCLFTRLTNALGVCGGVALITLLLLINGCYKNLCMNALAFIGGFAILFVPISLYFWANDAFDDMWYGTLLFNLKYVSHPMFGIGGDSTVSSLFRTFIDVYICMATALLLLLSKRKIVGVWMLSISVLLWLWLFNSHGFVHYGMLCVPCSCLIVVIIFSELQTKRSYFYKLSYVGVLLVYVMMNVTKLFFVLPKSEMNKEEEVLLRQIPVEDYSKIAAYDLGPYLYVKYNMVPPYKFFTAQSLTLSLSRSEEHRSRIVQEYSKLKAKWIMLPEWSKEDCAIRPILDEHYKLAGLSGPCLLYKLKD